MQKVILLSKWKVVISSSKTAVSTPTAIDRKIASALEKVSQVIRTLAWKKATEQSFNPIQLQILIFLLQHPEQQVSVSLLSGTFNISKASISDTIKLLERKMLIEKVYDPSDSRKFTIQLLAKGRTSALEAALFDRALLSGIGEMAATDKENLFSSLSQLLHKLYCVNVISHQRMCQTCQHYRKKENLHYCNLLQQYMAVAALQIDCPEHLALNSRQKA
ncbi:MarR family winged helix-turn-helix transcriptional regulator [Sphingobacterium sp. BIGb0165]|uniref:MarR family winged helix-turn-helix transcriptional regulator n=1 Tax=Sphingobacterium sp. BIGb0165 TaxID=2940615 RepID=UPI002167B26E|nr:MarR family winged helix-turn-helix transcriptional regulator [Sphingobacterium sp. BIGb0165]